MYTPVPVTKTSNVGLSGSFDGMLRVTLFGPFVKGENTTLIIQLDEGNTVCPEHLSSWRLNSRVSFPVRVIVPSKRSDVPTFEMINGQLAELRAGTSPKTIGDGITERFGVPPPVKGKSSVHALGVFDEMVTYANLNPADFGEKATSKMQFPDGTRVVPEQRSLCRVKSSE